MLEHLNYHSFLVPLFFLAIVCTVLYTARYYKLARYIYWFTAAVFLSIIYQIVQIFIVSNDLDQWILLNGLLFFSSTACMAHAVYLRLHIKTNWFRIITIICLAELIFTCFYLFTKPILEIYLIVITTTCLGICFNRPLTLLNSQPTSLLDRLLKSCFYLIVGAILIRGLYFLLFYTESLWLAHQEFIWASTQFLILCSMVIFMTIFFSCSIMDTIHHLHTERNIDPLTNVLNRRALSEKLNQFSDITVEHPHIILLCDLDHFKKINDQYGHNVGDLVLKHASKIMKSLLRSKDTLARIGGEEFQIVLCDLPKTEAIIFAEQLCTKIANTPLVYHQEKIYFTVSIGLYHFNDANDYDSALHFTDLLLYQAKKSGRNNVQWQLKN